MTEEITNPLFGRLNLFYGQLKTTGERVAGMRVNGTVHEEIDVELSYMGQLNIKLATICSENHLDIDTLMEKGVEAVVSRTI